MYPTNVFLVDKSHSLVNISRTKYATYGTSDLSEHLINIVQLGFIMLLVVVIERGSIKFNPLIFKPISIFFLGVEKLVLSLPDTKLSRCPCWLKVLGEKF
jgi:hypothetical protein